MAKFVYVGENGEIKSFDSKAEAVDQAEEEMERGDIDGAVIMKVTQAWSVELPEPQIEVSDLDLDEL